MLSIVMVSRVPKLSFPMGIEERFRFLEELV
jgi:hypothetical protein